ncbi:MAG: 3-isopropylmalate dehydratase small subunit [Gammaproteobacteria bacterium]|nr:3-isopropylmalate dehydratase small subunit [Gammaproteobacteria bacterium]
MKPFTTLDALVAPLDRANVDTDSIIPKQFLKSIHRTGFGRYLFDSWRYADGGGEAEQDCAGRPLREDFVLNQPRYRGAGILLARENFGCGSSREHAVWALQDFGFRCVIAPSFADIFHANCGKNGVLAVRLDGAIVDRLFREVAGREGYRLQVDLETLTLTTPDGRVIAFDIEDGLRQRLLHGLDDIGVTLGHADDIRAYERRRAMETPWLFPDREQVISRK